MLNSKLKTIHPIIITNIECTCTLYLSVEQNYTTFLKDIRGNATTVQYVYGRKKKTLVVILFDVKENRLWISLIWIVILFLR
jgi:hypothetical protein